MERTSYSDQMSSLIEGEEGFGVIEVVIVSVVISILAGVGIPAFNCIRRRAISQAAQTTIQQIKDECESNYIYGIDEFTATNPSQYKITSSGSNSCSAGTISLVPSDTTKYPTYLYKFNESELSYNFKGQTGTSFVACNKLICGEYNIYFVTATSTDEYGNLVEVLESKIEILKGTTSCSIFEFFFLKINICFNPLSIKFL